MKIYIASSFALIDKVKNVSHFLEREGHTITEKWWSRPYQVEGLGKIVTTDLKEIYEKLTPDEFYATPECAASYWKDHAGIMTADAFVFIANETPRKFNGASVELGLAIGNDIPAFSLGNLETSVLFYPVIRCRDLCQLISRIRKMGVTQ